MASVSTRHLALVAGLFALAAVVPALTSAADAQQLAPSADALVSHGRPDRNFGSAGLLRAQSGAFETYLRFKLTPWAGRPTGSTWYSPTRPRARRRWRSPRLPAGGANWASTGSTGRPKWAR